MDKTLLLRKVVWVFSLTVITWFFETFIPAPAQAIPAFARKYNADCSMCHYPNVPRLNSLGHEFRRAGYRMPDEFNKDQDISKVGDFLAVRGRARYDYQDREGQPVESQFQWHDTTFFYAGALTRNFSSFAELEWEASDDIGLVASVGGVFGQPDHYSTFRVGQLHVLSSVGFGGFDRPTGISVPSIRGDDLTTGGVPFRIGRDQRSLELAHVFKKSRLIAQLLNGVDPNGSGTEGDTDTAKDYALAFEQILDDLASGFTLYAYWGTWYDDLDPAIRKRADFARYAVTGNKIFPGILGGNLEVMGGYVHSQDNPTIAANVQGNTFFAEMEQYFESLGFTLLGRYDYVDPDDNIGNNSRQKGTVGYVQTLQNYLRLAVEGNVTRDNSAKTTDYGATAEVMVNF